MNQALYAHMNNKRKKKTFGGTKKKVVSYKRKVKTEWKE
jgi:hypothetical protein